MKGKDRNEVSDSEKKPSGEKNECLGLASGKSFLEIIVTPAILQDSHNLIG
jgi:hypothetical protein